LILYFEIDQSANKLGLLERSKKGEHNLLSDKNELQNDRLYYLYFRDKPLEKTCISPTIHGEESKKVLIFIW